MTQDQDRTSRPYTFLVSIAPTHGAGETLEALAPILSRLGTWRHVAHPESSLGHAAARASEGGGRPVHLIIGGAHAAYLTPALPNVFVPVWDYPHIPDVDMHRNTRMNWARIADRMDLILPSSRFGAEVLREAGVEAATVILPIPARAGWSEMPTWGPDLPIHLHVPHLVWGGAPDPAVPKAAPDAFRFHHEPPTPTSLRGRLARAGRLRLRRIKPFLSNATIHKLDAYRSRFGPMIRRPTPAAILGGAARLGYRHLVRRWIGEAAHGKLRRVGDRLVGRRAPAPAPFGPSCLPPSPLMLSGLVLSATIDYDDPTTDDATLLSAAIHAFRDRPDATLVVRLRTSPQHESRDLGRLAHAYDGPRIEPRCRVVVVVGPLSRDQEYDLARASSYHVETARTRGAAPALVEALASGRPAIAPGHSAYLDWVDDSVGLTVDSDPEPTSWPIDGVGRHTTEWNRVAWADLRDRLVEAAAIADDHRRYESLSASARRRVAERAAPAVAAETLRRALESVPARAIGAYAWGG